MRARKSEGGRLLFRCPGCVDEHYVVVDGSRGWSFNGNYDQPTLTPSVLVRYGDSGDAARCHSFVTDGRIQFLADCTHALAGQTVPLPELP